MKCPVPRMTTDAEAEAFLESDLSDLDFAQFKTVNFEFKRRHRASKDELLRVAPGAPAPKSGVYQQTGPRGGRPGRQVNDRRG